MIFRCHQSALDFGADRKTPVPTRPVAEVRREAGRAVVLPCTSQDKQNDPGFFGFDQKRLYWTHATPPDQRTFAFERYEVVAKDALTKKIGVIDHGLCLDLMAWLKERY